MVNNELLVTKCKSLTDDRSWVSCQFGCITWTGAEALHGSGLCFLLLSPPFIFFFQLEANWNSWCRPNRSTSKTDKQHNSSAKSLYCQRYSTISKKFSNPQGFLEKTHQEENFNSHTYSLTLRSRWQESYQCLKMLISENQESFLLFFVSCWLF